MKPLFYLSSIIFLGMTVGAVQARAQVKPQPVKPTAAPAYKMSAAFAELRVKQAELESEAESLLEEYTEEHPKVKEVRSYLGFLQKQTERLAAVTGNPERLTAALGRLMIREAELQAEAARLLETLQPAHPDVKRAKRTIEIFEAAIKEILG